MLHLRDDICPGSELTTPAEKDAATRMDTVSCSFCGQLVTVALYKGNWKVYEHTRDVKGS